MLIGKTSDTCESCIKICLAIEMGRICVDLPEELEKKLRFKTIEKFGGRKGDLAKAVGEAVETWGAKK